MGGRGPAEKSVSAAHDDEEQQGWGYSPSMEEEKRGDDENLATAFVTYSD